MLTLQKDAGAAHCPKMWILRHILFQQLLTSGYFLMRLFLLLIKISLQKRKSGNEK